MKPVELSVANKIAEIVIQREQALNSLDMDALRLLHEYVLLCRDDPEVRVIIITGAGEKAFCVGSDLKKQVPSDKGYDEMFLHSDEISAELGNYGRLLMFNRLKIWKPMIAAVNGYCVGGGMELALQCDMRVASTNASFGLPEAKVGSFPGAAGASLLPDYLPHAVAMKLMFTGGRIGAEEAHRYGLVSDLCAPSELMDLARDLAAQVAACGPTAVKAIKRSYLQSVGSNYDDKFEIAETYMGLLKNSPDRVEGRKAFAEKRKPNFRD